jgi:TonB family protein
MSTAAIYADREGRVIDGRFPLQRWLGGSAESGVYLTALDGEQPRRAAIKLIAADAPGAEIRLAGWTAAADLDHPHLTRVFHAGRAVLDGAEAIYCVTEYADEVLSEILPTRPLSPDETREMLDPVLAALAYLHGKGFAHGRLKPSNILVIADSLKLSADISPIAPGKTTAIPLALGPYDAPELGRGTVSPAADIWSLGMTIAAALTQRTPPWDRESGFEPVVRPALPAPFESIVRDCLRLDAASRLTLPEIKDHLEGHAPSQASSAAHHSEFDPDSNPTPAHSSRWAAISIATAVFLGIAVTALVLHSRQSPSPSAEQPPASAAEPQPSSSADQPPSAPSSSQAAAAQPEVAQKPPAAQPAHQGQTAAAPRPVAAPQLDADRAPTGGSAGNGGTGNAAIVKRVVPDVLPEARSSIRGKVHISVRVQVDASGTVTDAVSESPGASRYFNRIAIQAAQAWRFAPTQSGAPGVWVLQFEFRQDGTSVTASPRTP